MKRIWALLLCGVIFIGCVGCTQEKAPYVPTGGALADENETTPPPQSGGQDAPQIVLTYYPAQTMNPFQCMNSTNRALFSLIYQGLFAVDDGYKITPVLCKSYTRSLDMTRYTFHLEDAYFSDGTPLTAADVVASYTAAKASPYFGKRLQHVTDIAQEGSAVVLRLNTPMENLPILLDIPIVKAGEIDGSHPVGTGPFLFDSSSQEKCLRRQPGWWCSAAIPVSADTITLLPGENPAQIRDSFEFGGLTMACTDPGKIDYVDYRGDHELWDSESGQFLYLVCHSKSALFSHPEIQAALTHAIDRQSLINRYYHGFGRAATLPASPDSPYYNHTLSESYGYEPEKFAQAIAAADLSPEEKAVTLLLCSDDPMRVRVGTAIAQMLEEAGLTVTLSQVTSAKLEDQLRWGTYDLYLGQTKLSANMDLTAFFASNGALKYGGLSDAGIYNLCLEALANAGNYYSLHKAVMEEGQLCPILFQQYAIYLRRGVLRDLQPARDNLFYYTLGKTMEDALMEN